MSENSLWGKTRNCMRKKWQEATRHEDKLNLGIADVSFVIAGRHGWMELKHLHNWPKRPSSIVRCRHYSEDQRNFLRRKGRTGGDTWLFVQIGNDHLLFDWIGAQEFGTLNREDTLAVAQKVWLSRMDWDELAKILTEGC